MANKIANNIKLGVFVIAGLLLLIFALYMIGKKSNMFGSSFTLRARFRNVDGLRAGNNVRYAGIETGTVEKVLILNDTTIEVVMSIDEKARAYVRKNAQTTIGNPLNEKVRMGSLAGESQRREVKEQVQKLLASSQIIYGSLDSVEVIDADANKGAFMSPLLLLNEQPFQSAAVHEVEAFGPVSTLMPCANTEEAIALSKMGKGSLVSSIVTADKNIARDYVLGAGM